MYQLGLKSVTWVLSKLRRSEEGATLVYGALVMIGILAVSALAIDGSNAYLQRREMQTAADAAALAGAHVLASGGSESLVQNEVQTVAGVNGAIVESSQIEGGNIVRVAVRTEVDSYLAQIVDVDSLRARAQAAAAFEPIPRLAAPPSLCFDISCVDQAGEVQVWVDEIDAYCADSFQHYPGGATSGLYIHNPEPDNPLATDAPYSYAGDFREFARVGSMGIYEEYDDGTARVEMSVQNEYNRGFKIQLYLSGRTTSPPNSSSPYLTTATNNSDTEEWHYYESWTGTLTGLPGTHYEGALVKLFGAGAAFQVGLGATYYRADLFGSAGWAWLYVVEQPDSGITIFEDDWSAADVYLQLSECNHLAGTLRNEEPTNSCTFAWLDWDGTTNSAASIGDHLLNPHLNGIATVGDQVPGAPFTNRTQSIESALAAWTGETVPVSVCDDEQVNSTYPIEGFTGFELASLDFSDFPKVIRGRFEPVVVNSDRPTWPIIDYLARDVRLIE
ncbi:MAG: pilus assembly protein TadG-related protein [Chloroflexota bacterium]